MIQLRHGRAILAAVVFASAASAASAIQAQSPRPAPVAGASEYQVNGFRSARFGMSPAQVRAALQADFPGARIIDLSNPAEGTTALQATVPSLSPGPGPAIVAYVFGATSKALIQVNVLWVMDGEPTTEQRAAIVNGAVQLANYFQTLPSPPTITAGARAIGPNSLAVFAAADKKGSAVEVVAEGVSYQSNEGDRTTTSPPPRGAAVLRLSYIANPARPDVVRLAPGAF